MESRKQTPVDGISAPVSVDGSPSGAGIDIKDSRNRIVCTVHYYPGEDLRKKALCVANSINYMLRDIGT